MDKISQKSPENSQPSEKFSTWNSVPIVTGFLITVVIIFVIIAAVHANIVKRNTARSIETQTAVVEIFEDVLPFKGVLFFDEYVLEEKSPNAAYIDYVAQGQKIGPATFRGVENKTIIAYTYDSISDYNRQKEHNEQVKYQQSLESLSQISGVGTSNFSNTSRLVTKNHLELISKINHNDFENLETLQDDLTKNIIAKNYLKDPASITFNNAVSEDKQYYKDVVEISAEGFFSGKIDKYSLNGIDSDYIKNADSTEILEIVNEATSSVTENDSEYLGKIITSTEYCIAAKFSIDEVDNFPALYNYVHGSGEKFQLKLENSDIFIEADIVKFQQTDTEYLVVFSVSEQMRDYLSKRTVNVQLLKGRYEGVKIPRNAVHYQFYKKHTSEKVFDEKGNEKKVWQDEIVRCMGVYVMITPDDIRYRRISYTETQKQEVINGEYIPNPIIFGYDTGQEESDFIVVSLDTLGSKNDSYFLKENEQIITSGVGYRSDADGVSPDDGENYELLSDLEDGIAATTATETTTENVSDTTENTTENVSTTAGNTTENVSTIVGNTTENVSETTENTTENVSETTENITEAAITT